MRNSNNDFLALSSLSYFLTCSHKTNEKYTETKVFSHLTHTVSLVTHRLVTSFEAITLNLVDQEDFEILERVGDDITVKAQRVRSFNQRSSSIFSPFPIPLHRLFI